MEEKLERQLIDLADYCETRPEGTFGDEKTLNYCINDFQINSLPESNPIYTLMHDYSKRRQLYMSQVKKGIEPTVEKPKLDDFYRDFQATIKVVNRTYKKSKQQFEADIKLFPADQEDKENQTKNNGASDRSEKQKSETA
jgi:hypothetical protein